MNDLWGLHDDGFGDVARPSPIGPRGDGIPEHLLAGLNRPQREAVEHRGPALLIVAGAGSGKTRVLTHRVAGLLATREAWSSQILAITFTNKAAAEMRERVEHLVGEEARGMWIRTFHSACVRILRREAEEFGFKESFTIYDSGDVRALIKRLIKQRGADIQGLTPGSVSARISKLKNELHDVDSWARTVSLENPLDAAFLELWRDYDAELRRANAFDFDDLISQTVFLLRAFPRVAAQYRKRFRHILVDEYQDTNAAQYALIRELTKPVTRAELPELRGDLPGASLTVVGDSDQSIYAFRGADIRNITDFERDFHDARVIMLEQNYRSTQNILSAANAVIGNNFDRRAKNLWTDSGDGAKIIGFTGYSGHDEAQFVADEIVELTSGGSMSYSDVAVFYRTNAQTRALEEVLIRTAIPYKVIGGTKFYERAEIKDAMAYLITVANPDDALSLRRIMNVPKRGIGPATEAALQAHADEHRISLRDAMRRVDEIALGPKVAAAIKDLAALLDEFSARPEADPGEVLRELMSRSGYTDQLRRSPDPQDAARLENVEELVAVTREFRRQNPAATLLDFLTETSLVAAADELDDSGGQVSLMTLHTAKGLEFDAVFITGIEEELLPHRMAAQEPGGEAEERRLFYVGITRARQRLHLSLAMTRAQFGEVNPAAPSRYLEEIPAGLIDWRTPPSTMRAPSGQRAVGRWRDEPRESFVTGYRDSPKPLPKAPKKEFANMITEVRDNSAMVLEPGDRIRHKDFGEGRVQAVTGLDKKRVAEVLFDGAGRKRLLIKIAPIEKLSP
ncbi:DNA helicase-2 / ATP-dependent DNA helicase PcrA [Agrococcus baldri]|uniref:DNA 3'-5' helicase n=1 Tax=Agrococcus baldri TaxID=153730 RepID=A0AA94HKW3_9MICO|nr:UvrD-helicase domain-containing protein [Agrococcus baldri]SFS02106.1 DNA helicase-2 / ATP-dependent DNA helicase PcrA [Agrococcus baldri]